MPRTHTVRLADSRAHGDPYNWRAFEIAARALAGVIELEALKRSIVERADAGTLAPEDAFAAMRLAIVWPDECRPTWTASSGGGSEP